MAESEQYFNEGIKKDYKVQPKDSLFDMRNMQLISNENNTYAIEDMNGNIISFSVTQNYRPIMFAKAANHLNATGYLVVYSAYIGPLVGVTNGEIARVLIVPSGAALYIPQYNTGGLNFSINHQIEGFVFPENQNIERCYFTDFFNLPRAFNHNDPVFTTNINNLVIGKTYMVLNGVVNHSGTDYGPSDSTGQITVFTAVATTWTLVGGNPVVIDYVPVESLSWKPRFNMGNIGFKQWVNGQKRFGKWQYLYRLGTNEGVYTKWSYPTRPILIGEPNPGAGSIQSYTGEVGGLSTANSSMGIQLQITGIDSVYTKLQVAAVQTTAYNIDDTPGVIFDGAVTGSTMIITDFGNIPLSPLLIDDLNAVKVNILRVKTLTTTNNIMFIGNIVTGIPFVFDTAGIVVNVIEHLYPADFISQAIPATGGAIQALNRSDVTCLSGNVLPELWYKVFGNSGDTLTYNAITYQVGDTFFSVPNVFVFTTTGAAFLKRILRFQKYAGVWNEIPLELDYEDYKGQTLTTYCQSHWRNETYRTAIVWFDTIGNPLYADWIADKKIPPQRAVAADLQDNGNPIGFNMNLMTLPNGGPMNTPNRGYAALRSIGLRFDNLNMNNLAAELSRQTGTVVTLADLPNFVSGFSIVRAKRDAQILAQGMSWAIVWDDGSSNPRGTHPAATTPFQFDRNYMDSGGSAGIYGRRKNKYMFYSADMNFHFQGKPIMQDGDIAEIQDYYVEVNGSNAWGVPNTPGWDFHNKIYQQDTDAGAAPKGAQAGLILPIVYLVDTGQDITEADGELFYNTTRTDSGFAGIGSIAHSIGSRAQILFVSYGEGPGDNTGFGSFKESDWRKPIVNLIRPKANLYGGQDKSALATTQYLSTGHFQPLDAAFMVYLQANGGIASGIDVFGGDCYVNVMSLERNLRDESSGTPQISYGLCFPSESNVNVALRGTAGNTRYFARDRAYHGGTAPNGICFANPVQHENWTYNEAYSTDEAALFYQGRPANFLPTNQFRNLIRFAGIKTPGELVDKFRDFQPNDFKFVDGWAGGINNLRAKQMRLFYWQDLAVGTVPVQERAQVTGAIGAPITLGEGGIATRYDERTNFYGNQHQWGLTETPEGFVWFDFRRKTLCYMDTGTEIIPLSILEGMHSFFNNTVVGPDIASNDNPVAGKGIAGGYEPRFKRVLMSFKGMSGGRFADFTMMFDTIKKQFGGFMDIAPGLMTEFNNELYSIAPERYDPVGPLVTYSVGDLASEGNENFVCILAYTSAIIPIQPSADFTHWVRCSASNDIFIHNKSEIGRFYNIIYAGKVTFVVNAEVELEKIFENFRWKGNDKFFTKVVTRTSSQQGTDDNISGSKEYEFRNKGWFSSVPLDDTNFDRMQDYYMEVECTKDNRVNGDPLLSSNEKMVLLSVKTWYRKAF